MVFICIFTVGNSNQEMYMEALRIYHFNGEAFIATASCSFTV